MSLAELPPRFAQDLAIYEASKTDPHIQRVMSDFDAETPEAHDNLMTGLLVSSYVGEREMVGLMHAAGPVVGRMATGAALETDVDFVSVERRWRWLEMGRIDEASLIESGWLIWGRRGDYEHRAWMAHDPYQAVPALGVAVSQTGQVREFLTRPPADNERITVVRAREGVQTGEDAPLSERPEWRIGLATRPRIYHGLIVFTSRLLQAT